MPNVAKTHDDCRKTVCFLCMRKCERELTDFLIGKIKKLVKSDIDFNDPRVPRALCSNCSLLLRRKDSGDQNVTLPALFSFSSIVVKPQTRSSSSCECLICKIGKLKLNAAHPLQKPGPSPIQLTHSIPGPSGATSQTKTSEKRCSKCLSVIGRGLPHNCTPRIRHQNLKELVRDDPIGAEQIASSVIAKKEASPHGTVRLSQGLGGKLFPVTPGKKSLF